MHRADSFSHFTHDLVALQHAVHEISQRTPKVLSACQAVLVNEEHIVLEAGIQMRFQAQLNDDRVMVAVDVRVDTIEALEDLADESREGFWESNACNLALAYFVSIRMRGWEVGNSPIRLGNMDSLSTLLCTQAIRCSTYSGAGILVGRLKFSESCQRYSNLQPSA